MKFRKNTLECKDFLWSNKFFFLLLSEISFLAIRSFRPVGGLDAFRQAQTVWPIKVWNSEGFMPLQPSVPIKGIEHQTWLLELPLYQWIVYSINLVVRIDPIYISRLFSLACSLYIFYFLATQISRQINAPRSLLIILMISNPYMFYWMTTGLVDWLALALGAVSGQLALSNGRKHLLFPSLIIAAIGGTIKPSHSLFAFLVVLCFKAGEIKKKQLLMALFIFPGTMFLVSSIWQNWISNLYPLDDPRGIWSLNTSTFSWYFGTVDQYVHFSNNFLFVVQRLLPSFGGIFLVGLCTLGYLKTNLNWKLKIALLIIPTCYTIGLINLNVSHYYYQIPMALILSMIVATGLVYWYRHGFIQKIRKEYIFSVAAILLFSFTYTGNNMSYIKSTLVNEPANTECLSNIQNENSTVLLVNWENPAFFYDCGIKSFQVNLNKNTDAGAFASEKYKYRYVYVYDNYKDVSQFIGDLNGSLQKVLNTRHWYQIKWS